MPWKNVNINIPKPAARNSVITVPAWNELAEKASMEWNQNENILLVIGATYPEELHEIRSIVGDMTFLVPGIGAQGGDVEKAVKNGKNSKGTGMIINSSRGIIYAGRGKDFAVSSRNAAIELRDEINKYR